VQGEPAHQTNPITVSDTAPAVSENPHLAARNVRHPELIAIARILARRAAQEWMIRAADSNPQSLDEE
jgi:hypothetical protein